MKKVVQFLIMIFMFSCFLSVAAQEAKNLDSSEFSPTADEYLKNITPDEESPLEKKILNQRKYSDIPNFVSLYNINYLLPYYYTQSTYDSVYTGNTPSNQSLMQTEFKGRFSIEVPLIDNLFKNKSLSLQSSYTQLVYWQVYAKSQYFRETNYEPSVFLDYHLYRNWLMSSGFNHQSNGRGGQYERSWNRVFATTQFSGKNWFTKVDVWGLVFQSESSDLHNSDIEKYLGHEHITLAYKISDLVLSLELQNIESGLTRGYIMAAVDYPLTPHINLYAQYFNGYGQSLIEYDHLTQAFGLGVSFNNWL